MTTTTIAGLLILGGLYVLGWCLLKIASRDWIAVEKSNEMDAEPGCTRCRRFQAEHGVAEFPTCLKCGAEGATHCDHGVLLTAECGRCDSTAQVGSPEKPTLKCIQGGKR